MSDIVVKNGLDIPIAGEAIGDVISLPDPETVAYSPTEFRGFVPRLMAREGDELKVGAPIMHHKIVPSVVLRSPVAGRVREVRRGHRRVITDYVMERHGDVVEPMRSWDLSQLQGLSRDEAIEAAAGSGWWPAVRTRPLSNMADPSVTPQAVVIAATETGPLQPSAGRLLSADDADALQAAVHVLAAITGVTIHVTQMAGEQLPALDGLQGVTRHTFKGVHPAGDPALQINLLVPPRGGGQVWYLRAWEAVGMGRTLLSGQFHQRAVYSAVGMGAKQPRFVETLLGAPLRHIVGDTTGEVRWIRGSILTGEGVAPDRWASFFARAVHVLPEHVESEFIGWALPQLGKWSFHKTFLSGFSKSSRKRDLRPGLYGGHRAIVPVGYYGRVVATPDLLPAFLFRSIAAGDLEESIQLGLLDITEEEAALCSYICPSKQDFDIMLREGLDLYEREI